MNAGARHGHCAGLHADQERASGVLGLKAGLSQFVKHGALSAKQAVAFTAQAEAIYA